MPTLPFNIPVPSRSLLLDALARTYYNALSAFGDRPFGSEDPVPPIDFERTLEHISNLTLLLKMHESVKQDDEEGRKLVSSLQKHFIELLKDKTVPCRRAGMPPSHPDCILANVRGGFEEFAEAFVDLPFPKVAAEEGSPSQE